MKAWTVAGVMVAVVIVGAVAYGVRGLAPTQAAIEEGNAFTTAHNKMMAAMKGDRVTYSGDPDRDFAMLMIPHHQGAIDMAKVELKYGSDPTVRALAQGIMAAQQPEIDRMQAWEKDHQVVAAPTAAVVKAAYGTANDTMMNGMMGDSMAHSGNADVDFIKSMIPHHQGAIEMANIELKYGTDATLRMLAQDIAAAQQAEIAEMKTLLAAGQH